MFDFKNKTKTPLTEVEAEVDKPDAPILAVDEEMQSIRQAQDRPIQQAPVQGLERQGRPIQQAQGMQDKEDKDDKEVVHHVHDETDEKKQDKKQADKKEPALVLPADRFDASGVKVRSMPDKFLAGAGKKVVTHAAMPGEKRKITGIKKNILVGVIIGVLVIAILSLAGWFLIKSIETPPTANIADLENLNNAKQEAVEPEPESQPAPVSECSAAKCRLCSPEECLELSHACHLEDLCLIRGYRNEELCPDYMCVLGPLEEEEEKEEPALEELVMARDTDSDLLTDIEEGLWGTDPLNNDTDEDGYNDGVEVTNLYNPVVKNIKLVDSELIKTFANTEYGYSIYYPSSWQLDDFSQTGDQIMFTSKTGEFVQVIVQENYAGYLTAKEWYLSQNSSVSAEDLEEVLIGNWSGVQSPDKLNVYLINNNYIYTVTYNVGLKTELNYKTTFEMMLKSFRLFESPL